MTPEQYKKLTALFQQAMERPREDRESFVPQLCGDDAELLPNLLRLIRSAEDSSETLVAQFEVDGYLPSFSPNEVLLNRFRIVRFLGRGGMGEVYEADDAETGRVALKTIRPEIAEHPYVLERFRREVLCARKVTGTNVCRIHELFSLPASHGRPSTAFLTMEFLEGCTLSDRIDTDPPLTVHEAENIAVQICRGLQTIHEAGVIHRDLKSRNIMLAERARGTFAVLMDFGLAREASAASSAVVGGTGHTVPGAVVGTPEYMAPEQFQGGTVIPATDIYALGVVLYEMATGRLPFKGSTPLAAAVERAKPLGPVSSFRNDLPHRWDTTIERCLRYKPEERFQTAADVADALTAHSVLLLSLPEYVNRHRRITFGAFVSIAVLGIVAFFLYRSVSITAEGTPEARHWYDQGVAALQEGTYLKATKALQMAADLDKNFVLAHARLADAWSELDFAGRAKDEMLQASSLESGRKLTALDRKYVEAVRHTIIRNFPAALRDYRDVFKALPDNQKAEGYLDLGRAYEKEGAIDQAIASYSAAAKLNPQNPAPFLRLGILESRRKQTDDANAAFVNAERLYRASSNLEGVAEIDFQRGNDANTQHHLSNARTYLQNSLKTAEAIPSPQLEIRALTRLSVTEYLDRNTSASINYANQAIKLAQENGLEYWDIDALIRLGNAYISNAEYDNAATQLQRALALAQRSQQPRLIALAQFSLASVRENQNKPNEAITLAKAALDYYRPMGFASESAEALLVIVRAERDNSDNRAALNSARELLTFSIKMNSPAAIVRGEESLGSVLLDMERYPEALDHFSKALATSRTPGSQFEYQLLHCANVHWRLGEYDEAERELSEIPAGVRSRTDITLIMNEILSGMLLSQRRYRPAGDIARHALSDRSNADPGYFERLLGYIETESRSPVAAQEWCRKALTQAQHEDDHAAIAASNLALANAYLAAGAKMPALSLVQSAHDFFVSSGQQESEYLSLLSLAKISQALGDRVNSRKFAQEGLDILSEFEHNWTPQQYKTYSSRPDISRAVLDFRRLLAS